MGGVAWAILVARTCKNYPNLKPNKLLYKFFKMYLNWDWPDPILIDHLKESTIQVNSDMVIWNAKSRTKNLMPIITPAYPPFNSTFNVSMTTRSIILKEMEKALKVMKRIRKNESGLTWKRLFKKLPFYKAYRFYLKIDIMTNDYDHKRFFGFIESKLKKLIQFFEQYHAQKNQQRAYGMPITEPDIVLHPWMSTEIIYDPNYKTCETFFFGLDMVMPPPFEEYPENSNNEGSEGEGEKQEKANSVEENGITVEEKEIQKIKIDSIIDSFYDNLLPIDETYLHQDFPKDQFPHNVNVRIQVVTQDQIPIIIAQKAPEITLEEVASDGSNEVDNDISGLKRFRDGDNMVGSEMLLSNYKRTKVEE